eukprot:m.148432 g.148432  ORF g.148432 m.148432 type:complete len:281 (-) comp52741_c0_seq1:254-1096(-)
MCLLFSVRMLALLVVAVVCAAGHTKTGLEATAASISVLGQASVAVNAFTTTYVESGFNCTDAGAPCQNALVTVSLAPASASFATFSFIPGTYYITYAYTSAVDNTTVTAVRTVSVSSTSAPQIALIGPANVTVLRGSVWADPGFYAWDVLDGNVTSKVVLTLFFIGANGNVPIANVTTATPGEYLILYNVTNSVGLWSATTRLVIVSVFSNTCNTSDNGAVTTAFLGVSVFIVACVLLSSLFRQKGIVVFSDTQSDPGFIHQSMSLIEDDETKRILTFED